MNQEEFIKSFIKFDEQFVKKGLGKTDMIVSLFKIWYESETQKWINIRNFNLKD